MWFNNKTVEPKTYIFEPNKVNVIIGDKHKGKSSVMHIIDYCLMTNDHRIPDDIVSKVSWFGIIFSIGAQKYAIARKSPMTKSDFKISYFNQNGVLPGNNEEPKSNANNIFAKLNEAFNITPNQGELNLSLGITFRNFLAFCNMSEDFINRARDIIDLKHFAIDQKNFTNIFYPAIGIDLQANNRMSIIDEEIRKVESELNKQKNIVGKYKEELSQLYYFCQNNQLIELNDSFNLNEEKMFSEIETAYNKISNILNTDRTDIEGLIKKKNELELRIKSFERLQKEYKRTIDNARNIEDSLLPITMLKENYADQICNFYDTMSFIDMLSQSLLNVKQRLNTIPLDFADIEYEVIIDDYKSELSMINSAIDNLKKSQNIILATDKLIAFGQMKCMYAQLTQKVPLNGDEIDKQEKMLRKLYSDYKNAKEEHNFIIKEQNTKKDELNNSMTHIIKQFDYLNTYYSNIKLKFEPYLKELQPYDDNIYKANTGSAAVHVFFNLAFYLGFHQYCLKTKSLHIPSFLIIDQPCMPFLNTNDDKKQMDNIFRIMNTVMKDINDNKQDFQLIVLDHADESYWKGKYENFHTVAKFIDGEGLLPKELF